MFFQDFRKRVNEEEGVQFPSNSYRQMVLQPAYDEARKHFLDAMVQIHIAHLKMLEEQKLVPTEQVRQIAHAIQNLDLDYYKTRGYNPQFEDLFFRYYHNIHCLFNKWEQENGP